MYSAYFYPVLSSLFTGFGIYSLIYVVLSLLVSEKFYQGLKEYDRMAYLLFSVLGLVYLMAFAVDLAETLISGPNSDSYYTYWNRLTGRYWFALWIQPFIYAVITQIGWFRKMRQNRIIRIAVAPFAIVPIEIFILYMVDRQREFISFSWSAAGTWYTLLLYAFICFAGFSALALILYFIRYQRSKRFFLPPGDRTHH